MAPDAHYVRGDIWKVDFGTDPTNPEQGFQRPALIVSDDSLHHPRLRLVVVVPGTSRIRQLPLHVVVEPDPANGLDLPTALQVEQVRAISGTRLIERLGRADIETQYAVDEILRGVLRLP